MVIVRHHIHEVDVLVDDADVVAHFDEGRRRRNGQRQQVRAVLALVLAADLVQQLHEVNPLGVGSVGKFPIQV